MDKISTKEIPENPGIYIFKDKYNEISGKKLDKHIMLYLIY